MSPRPAVRRAIARAESILPGMPAPQGKPDPRWQAIIRVSDFIETDPEPLWQFALLWGKHAQADLRMAVACCLLEHLLEEHFDMLFPRVRQAALKSPRFADTVMSCWVHQQKLPAKDKRFRQFQRQLWKRKLNRDSRRDRK